MLGSDEGAVLADKAPDAELGEGAGGEELFCDHHAAVCENCD